MPSQLVEWYIKNQEIEPQKRQNMAQDLDAGVISEQQAEEVIQQKYGDKLQAMANQQVMSQGWKQSIGGDVGVGIAKGALSTASGMSELGQRGLQAATGWMGVKPQIQSGGAFQSEGGVAKLTPKLTTPEGVGESIGFGGEQIAEFFAPGALLGKVSKAAPLVNAGQKLSTGQKVLGLGKNMAKGAAEFGGVTALQEGELNTNVGISAGIGAALPFVGAAGKGISKLIHEKLPSRLVNRMLQPQKGAFMFGKNPGLAVAKEGIKGNNLGQIGKGIGERMGEVGKQITAKVAQGAKVTPKVDVAKIITDTLQKYQTKITDPQASTRLQNVLQQLTNKTKLSPTGQLIVTGQKPLTNVGAVQVHKMQQLTGQLTQWTGQGYEKPVNQFLKDIYVQLGKKLPEGTKTLQGRWANLLGAQKALEQQIAVSTRRGMIGAGSAVGGLYGAQFGESIPDRLRNIAIGVALPALMRQPALRSRVASFAAKAPVVPSGILPKATLAGIDLARR